jgi:hypothetical protein
MINTTRESLFADVRRGRFLACGNCFYWQQAGVDKTLGICLNSRGDYYAQEVSAVNFGHCQGGD